MSSRRDRTASPTARPVDWLTAGACSHAVQFYEDDSHLVDLLTRFVGTAIVSGDAALVVATKVHRDGLIKHLKANGLDVGVAREQGRFVALDAESTLAKLVHNGELNPEVFRDFAGDMLDKLVRPSKRRRLVAFGEMVALLWAQDKADTAIRLETLWNEVTSRYDLSLCCGYPIKAFRAGHAAPFMKICAQHSHVFTVARANHSAAAASAR